MKLIDFISKARKNGKKISNKLTQKIIEREIAMVRKSKIVGPREFIEILNKK